MDYRGSMNISSHSTEGMVVIPMHNQPISDSSHRLWEILVNSAEDPKVKTIVLNCEHRSGINFMEAMVLNTIAAKLKRKNKQLALCFQEHKFWNDFRLSQVRGIIAMYSTVDEAIEDKRWEVFYSNSDSIKTCP